MAPADGKEAAALAFTRAMRASGLFGWVKATEVVTVLANATLAWVCRDHFWPLFVWRGRPDYSLDPRLPAAAQSRRVSP